MKREILSKMSLSIAKETKIDTEPCIAAWNNKLFVGAENGSILVSLKPTC